MDGHPSRPPVSRRLERRTRSLGGPRQRDLLRLAPDGVWQAGRVATAAGGLLLHPFTLTGRTTGGLLSVPLSVGFRRLGFPQRPALRCPDFPRTAEAARGHPACTPSLGPGDRAASRAAPPCKSAYDAAEPTRGRTTAGTSLPSASSERHSGHARTPRRRMTNSPQHEALRGSRRGRARGARGRASGRVAVTSALIAGSGTPPRPCRGSGRGRRRSARARVLRLEADAAVALAVERLHGRLVRRLVVTDERDHDIAASRVVAPLDDDRVAVEDPGLDHRVAVHREQEVRAAPDRLGDRDDVLDVLLGEQRGAGGHTTKQRQAGNVARGGCVDSAVAGELDRPRLRRIAADEPDALEVREMGVDRRRRRAAPPPRRSRARSAGSRGRRRT